MVPEKTNKNYPQDKRIFHDAEVTMRSHNIIGMAAQMKRGTKDEVNSLPPGKVLDNRRVTVEVNDMRAFKLGDQ